MITSKLTSNSRTTIPKAVREALGLRLGDTIAYVIAEDQVVMTSARPGATADAFATFNEWAGDADRKAYAEL